MLDPIRNLDHYEQLAEKEEFFLLAFYTESSEKSQEALKRLVELKAEYEDTPIYSINASEVKDVHRQLGVSSVPTVVAVKKGHVAKTVEGLQDKEHYALMLFDAPVKHKEGENKKVNHVVVYSTPSCSWCNRLKSYLRKNRIMFRDVDVSRDLSLARDLQARTGQTGVPQTEINGQWVVGFDQKRIDQLLGLA